VIAANTKRAEERRAAHAAELAALRRVLIRTFPEKAPAVGVLVDVSARELTFFGTDELDDLRDRLPDYDVIGAVNVRAALKALDFDPGDRRLAELGPPQKSRTLNKSGRKLKITLDLLVRGSCGISRPFGDPKQLRGYIAKEQTTKLRRRLEADAKSLFAIYQYGMLHGAVVRSPHAHARILKIDTAKAMALERGSRLVPFRHRIPIRCPNSVPFPYPPIKLDSPSIDMVRKDWRSHETLPLRDTFQRDGVRLRMAGR